MPKFGAMKVSDGNDPSRGQNAWIFAASITIGGTVGRSFGRPAALAAALCATVAGPAWSKPASEALLREEIRSILRAPEVRDAVVGVHVRSVKDGRTIFAHNAQKLFNPASNQKLVTTAAALYYMGPSYRFRTDVRRSGTIKGGVLDGDLYVIGRGDPTLTTETLFGLVNEVAMRGVSKVDGDLIVDDTFFDSVFEGPGWDQEIGDHAYAAPIGALSVNFNTFALRILPGSTAGKPLEAEVWPPVPSVEVIVKGRTRGRNRRGRIWIGTTRQPDDSVRVTVRGALSTSDQNGRIARRRVHNPTRYAGEMIYEMLKMRGVEVTGRVRAGAVDPRSTAYLYTHRSAPLSTICSTLNKYSNNFMAEQVLKTLGAEVQGAPGTWSKGRQTLSKFLTELGVPPDSFVLANGSGLNDTNRVTPTQITLLLQQMHQRFELRPEFVASLAVAGDSGTINGRFENSPAVSRLRAKTGSLTGVSALSGYVMTKSNEVFAFSIMMNDYRGRASMMWHIQDEIGIALAEYGTDDRTPGGAEDVSAVRR